MIKVLVENFIDLGYTIQAVMMKTIQSSHK